MGGLSLGFSEKLIMRFGPRNILIPGFIMVTVALLLFARTPVDGNYLTDLLPPFLLIAVGIGTSFPGIMTLAMSGRRRRTPGSPRASSTPACRWVARSAWRCWRRSRPSAPKTSSGGPLDRLGADLRLPPRLPGRRRARLRLGVDRDLRAQVAPGSGEAPTPAGGRRPSASRSRSRLNGQAVFWHKRRISTPNPPRRFGRRDGEWRRSPSRSTRRGPPSPKRPTSGPAWGGSPASSGCRGGGRHARRRRPRRPPRRIRWSSRSAPPSSSRASPASSAGSPGNAPR